WPFTGGWKWGLPPEWGGGGLRGEEGDRPIRPGGGRCRPPRPRWGTVRWHRRAPAACASPALRGETVTTKSRQARDVTDEVDGHACALRRGVFEHTVEKWTAALGRLDVVSVDVAKR